jgi:predicted DNA-binding transcriptional regulator AlpA
MTGVDENGGSPDDRLSLTEVARLLGMSRPNVRLFLERRGVFPVDDRPYRRKWRRSDVEQVLEAYKLSERFQSDQRRREAAQRSPA